MGRNRRPIADSSRVSESGAVHKSWVGRLAIALIYPNAYSVGISNLGFQTVYRLWNEMEEVVCERMFLPEDGRPPISLESGRPLTDFDVAAFSISFENDFRHVLAIFRSAGIPFFAKQRNDSYPLVVAGGVACFLNPEPLAPFVDVFLLGEAEELLPEFVYTLLRKAASRQDLLHRMAHEISGAYVPGLYRVTYHEDGTIRSRISEGGVPDRIPRRYVSDVDRFPAYSQILTSDSPFADSFLIETGRGCVHGCRFCTAGYIYRPPRYRSPEILEDLLRLGAGRTNRIGLVGAAISDLPDLSRLCHTGHDLGLDLSFSSLRADSITDDLIGAMIENGVKTATLAPDAGSERMRKVINKGITEEHILLAAEKLVYAGVPNLKLYFMIGLPTETMEDVEAVVQLVARVRDVFLRASRIRRRIGEITVSIHPFVPKASTPFQWVGMNHSHVLQAKARRILPGLNRMANVRASCGNIRDAVVQAVLSRGDRRVADILVLAEKCRWNWARTFKEADMPHEFFAFRERKLNEVLPWDFIDHGIHRSWLEMEYRKAIKAKPGLPCPIWNCSRCGVCVPASSIEDAQKESHGKFSNSVG